VFACLLQCRGRLELLQHGKLKFFNQRNRDFAYNPLLYNHEHTRVEGLSLELIEIVLDTHKLVL